LALQAETAALMAALREKALAFTADRLANFSVKDMQAVDADTLGVFSRDQIQSLRCANATQHFVLRKVPARDAPMN